MVGQIELKRLLPGVIDPVRPGRGSNTPMQLLYMNPIPSVMTPDATPSEWDDAIVEAIAKNGERDVPLQIIYDHVKAVRLSRNITWSHGALVFSHDTNAGLGDGSLI